MKKTKKAYEQYLNEIGESLGISEWIIGGQPRYSSHKGRYGVAIRKYDPIGFNVGYNDWSKE